MNNVSHKVHVAPVGSDNLGDDEASVDGSYTHQNDIGNHSDQDRCHSEETDSNNDNEIDMTEGNYMKDGDSTEEAATSNESIADFFKLLPYLYLIQKNYGVNTSLVPGFELTNSQLSNSGEFSDSPNFRTLLESDHFKHLQQLLPYGNCYNGNNNNNGEINFNGNNVGSDDELHCNDSSEHDEPLDLTQKTKDFPRALRDEKSNRPTQRAERSYTIQDLELALQDIQSGKLGTRRAAVIYGIPRSTLRNKVYKLGKASQLKSTVYNGVHDRERDDFEMPHDDCNRESPNALDNHVITMDHARFLKENPYSLISRGGSDTLAVNQQGRINDGHNNDGGERNQLLFMGGGRSHNQRGRHGSRPSLSLPNYPRAQSSGAAYENFSDSSLGKKSRPKRGKYRNYDREALAKAVQAVQNGEMSVHRAGSYFGVPHSTLEYKVKERHLLRQAKFKGKSTAAANKPVVIFNGGEQQSASLSLAPLSPSAMVDSNDSSNFPKTLPDMGKGSLSHFVRHGLLNGETRWRSPLLGLGLTNAGEDSSKKEINAPLPKIYDPNESLENNPSDLLDLTSK
ncbi:uncharacterized protein LOC110851286 isoform X1 [Folsomia candida]|uniref:uncharacterized protein LOC110851286 isoform X1 n=1 Tax=Folsomia candida TaxID=158441 RepID=UPI000B8FACC8|nr:uncharacterized protein LOC110851286 isoform X1 [Folsomia candida]